MGWQILLPIAFKYGVPIVAYIAGHIIGWFHHKKKVGA
jgi:hypothetical protein